MQSRCKQSTCQTTNTSTTLFLNNLTRDSPIATCQFCPLSQLPVSNSGHERLQHRSHVLMEFTAKGREMFHPPAQKLAADFAEDRSPPAVSHPSPQGLGKNSLGS